MQYEQTRSTETSYSIAGKQNMSTLYKLTMITHTQEALINEQMDFCELSSEIFIHISDINFQKAIGDYSCRGKGPLCRMC